MSASIHTFTPRERVAVLTCPVANKWHVTCYEVGTGTVLKHRVFYNAVHACNLVSVLEWSWGHRIVLGSEAERFRGLLYCGHHASGGAR